MQTFFLIIMALFLGSCATKTLQTERVLKKNPVSMKKIKLQAVPFIEQSRNQCGPSTMAMVMNYWGKEVSPDDLMPMMFTKELEGTFQSEMITTPRLYGFMSMPVNTVESLIKEIEQGHPVILFQNIGLNFLPKWHYALAVGYDLSGPDLILHSGSEKFKRMDMRLIERNWNLAGYWGLVVLPPDRPSVSSDEGTHAMSAAALESLGKIHEAEIAYQTILKRWPHSLLAHVGLGNTHYKRKDLKKSLTYLKKASSFHPESSEVWHNLATVQGELGLKKEAKESSLRAIKLADETVIDAYKVSLKNWL